MESGRDRIADAINEFNPEKALIFRITHRNNARWLLDNGLHSRNSNVVDAAFVQIGNADLIEKRRTHSVRCKYGGTLGDYVPFYFTSFSPMFYNIHTGWNGIRRRENDEIVILVSSLHRLLERSDRFVFTDRHASLAHALFFTDLADLNQIDWDLLQRRDFQRSAEDPGKVERYEAEALVYKHLLIDSLLGIFCHDDSVTTPLAEHAAKRGLQLKVTTQRNWYF